MLQKISYSALFIFTLLNSIYAANNTASSTTLEVRNKSSNVSALPTTLQTPMSVNQKPLNNVESKSEPTQISMSGLNSADSAADNLVALKRKLEVEKAEAELKKIRSGGQNANRSNGQVLTTEDAQTTVTGVAINQEGKKIAWLQFADGGSLTVNVGSQVGKYMVSNITMSGVELSTGKNKKVFLKRAYYTTEKSGRLSNNSSKLVGFTPSPVVTNANDDMVPPIVPGN